MTGEVEDRDAVSRALQQLTIGQRAILVLHYYVGLSQPEIAEATRLPVGTVKSRLSRSLAYMQAALAADSRMGGGLGRERS
jgi:RNA polymerase sigma factor (sigma-70 family)